ncbi:MAG: hypothetical protein AAF456_04165 [Planctomycetota bacterium]
MRRVFLSREALAAIAVAIVFAIPQFSAAQDVIRTTIAGNDWYGPGVHHFFRGEYPETIQKMDVAISLNQNDPRPYYFRGLANMAMGETRAGNGDLMMAARVEAMRSARPMREVNSALERIQGWHRLDLEAIRHTARLQVMESMPAGRPGGAPMPAGAAPMPGGAPPMPGGASPMPAGAAPMPQGGPAPVPGQFTPAPSFPSGNPAPAQMSRPDAPMDIAQPAQQGGAPMTEAQPADVQPTTPAGGDPFGGGAPAGGGDTNPFGGGAPAGGGDTNPFGGGAPAGGGDSPAAGGNPFGGGAPAGGGDAPAAGGNPFGGGNSGGGVVDDPFGG